MSTGTVVHATGKTKASPPLQSNRTATGFSCYYLQTIQQTSSSLWRANTSRFPLYGTIVLSNFIFYKIITDNNKKREKNVMQCQLFFWQPKTGVGFGKYSLVWWRDVVPIRLRSNMLVQSRDSSWLFFVLLAVVSYITVHTRRPLINSNISVMEKKINVQYICIYVERDHA